MEKFISHYPSSDYLVLLRQYFQDVDSSSLTYDSVVFNDSGLDS